MHCPKSQLFVYFFKKQIKKSRYQQCVMNTEALDWWNRLSDEWSIATRYCRQSKAHRIHAPTDHRASHNTPILLVEITIVRLEQVRRNEIENKICITLTSGRESAQWYALGHSMNRPVAIDDDDAEFHSSMTIRIASACVFAIARH